MANSKLASSILINCMGVARFTVERATFIGGNLVSKNAKDMEERFLMDVILQGNLSRIVQKAMDIDSTQMAQCILDSLKTVKRTALDTEKLSMVAKYLDSSGTVSGKAMDSQDYLMAYKFFQSSETVKSKAMHQ